jgi:hypothetical protein
LTPDSLRQWPLPGSGIRVVYSVDGLELFAIGVLVHSGLDAIIMEQYSDQYGPVEPYLLTIEWSAIVRLTVNGPALRNTPRYPRTA